MNTQELLRYWQEQLNGIPPLLELPKARPRPTVQTFRGRVTKLAVNQELSQKLNAFSQKAGVRLFTTLCAAFSILLHRYTGQEDLVVVSGLANRHQKEIESLESLRDFWVKLLPLRIKFHGNTTFLELLNQIQQTTLEAYAHQDFPWEKWGEELQPETSTSYSPLFQVAFLLENGPPETLEPTSLNLKSLETEKMRAKLDLTVMAWERNGEIQFWWEYNTDLFEGETIERMTKHFQTLLVGIMANPEQNIGQLPILTQVERNQLLLEWNQTETDYPQEKCIHQLFEEQAAKTPNAIAVVFEEEQLTYQELNQKANQLAYYLQKLGVKAETKVGICVERSLEMIIGLLGIMKAGGVYVPLDPDYPQERLKFMLEDSKLSILLTQEKLVHTLPIKSEKIVKLDTNWQLIKQESPSNLVKAVQLNNLAYIIYTSGSTGKAKGVLITHQSILSHYYEIQSEYQVESSDRFLQFASLNFDISLEQIFVTLNAGATLFLRGKNIWTEEEFLDKLRNLKLTIIDLSPAYFQQLIQHWNQQSLKLYFEYLRLVIIGGDKLSIKTVEYWQKLSPSKVRFFNAYGPTETTITSTLFEIKSSFCEDNCWKTVPIGRPLSETKVYILNQYLQPQPIGIPGELYIGGDRLAKGYLHNPELTEEKFIPNPFGKDRLYKTGDLCRYLPDGNIEFLGRIDHQVKIHGFRIELEEIEAILSQYPAVGQTVVMVRENQPDNKRLVAYIVPQQEIPNISELRSFLKTKLPDYMIPNAFIMLEVMPLTANGKIDRQALPTPDSQRPDLAQIFVAPQTPTEIKLAQIWSEVLGIEPIGVNDNFFELGGDSLAAAKILGRVRDVFKVELPFEILLHNLTIVESSQLIEKSQQTKQQRVFSSIKKIRRQGDLPVSFPQEQVYFIQQLAPNNLAYQFQMVIEFQGQLNVERLKQCLTEIIQRHEILRTTFHLVDGKPVQRIHERGKVNLSVVELEHLSGTEQQAEMQRQRDKALRYQFDSTQLPLVYWVLLKLRDSEYTLIHVEDHLIHDGWSSNIFLRELLLLYQAFGEGQSSPLPELPIQFADFAAWQRQWMEGETAQAQLAYWQQKLTGSPPLLNLLGDRPRPSQPSYQGDLLRVELPLPLCRSLREMSRQGGMTLFMTMLTAFLILLYRYTAQEDICIGSGLANRRLPETEDLIGMFVNALPLRTDLSGNPTFMQLRESVREVTLEAHTNQDLPLAKVIERLIPERDLSYHPLFQVLFSFHDSPLPNLKLTELEVNVDLHLTNGSAKFDLNIIVIPHTEESKAGITVDWEYNTDLFEEETIERMANHFQTLLAGIVANPEQKISQLPILTELERNQLLGEWNETQTDYPQDKCIHQLFEEQVAKTPDAVAIVFEQQQLTYQQLNARANQLAYYLRSEGVTTETLVGICIERSPLIMIALLAILKAGGAYLPLDPDYPQQRLECMLEDAQVSLILTTEKQRGVMIESQAQLVCLDTHQEIIQQQNQDNLNHNIQSKHLAYVMYTSGSTGQPKGVCITHQGVVRLVKKTNYASFTSEDVFLQLAPISFDASTLEIWASLLNGGKLVVMPPHLPSLAELGAAIEKHQVTTLWLTAGLFNLMVDEKAPELKNVRQIFTGGDVVSVNHVQKLLEKGGKCKIINGYGPTENTTFTCCYAIEDVHQLGSSIPIGKAIANTQVYILDSNLNPTGIGVPGELYLGGDGLARGYLHRPDLNAEKFIVHPFSDKLNARLYQTGDRARYLADGNIEFLGRLDHQVKIRGFRIEPGEIEFYLSQYPTVKETVVVARGETLNEKSLVAYLVPHKQKTLETQDVRRFLQERLPEYMIPSAFVFLDGFPLTPNGKIDREALPEPNLAANLESEFVAPSNQTELSLAQIWQEVLGIEKIGINDNFFRLGGHSLLATQVVSRINNIFARELALSSLFEFPTIAELGQYLRKLDYLKKARQLMTPQDFEEIEL